jgi:DNA polymerase-3 subunit delta'
LASTFLFVGPAGIGKRAFAEKLAQSLLCSEVHPRELAPCGRCTSCLQVEALTHPDLHIVEKPPDKSTIPLSLFVGDEARRMREGLCHDIALKPFMGGRRVAIIDDADDLNEESANCLLKTLEEPPPCSILILIGTSPAKQLPTIRSRCQTIRFRPLTNELVAEILRSSGVATDSDQARRMAEFSGGSLQQAQDLADEELWTFRQQLLRALSGPRLESVALAQSLGAFVDAAGKEASARRARSRQLIAFAADFYRQMLRAQSGLAAGGDAELVRAVEQARSTWPHDFEAAAGCLDRSLEALAHIDRNANQVTLLECWLDDLARIVETGQPLAGASQ